MAVLKKVKKEGNESLKNWDFLPEGLKLFYEDIPLKTVIFLTGKNGTKIRIKRKDIKYSWDCSDWLFKFNKETNRFGLFCGKELMWIYGTNDEEVMS